MPTALTLPWTKALTAAHRRRQEQSTRDCWVIRRSDRRIMNIVNRTECSWEEQGRKIVAWIHTMERGLLANFLLSFLVHLFLQIILPFFSCQFWALCTIFLHGSTDIVVGTGVAMHSHPANVSHNTTTLTSRSSYWLQLDSIWFKMRLKWVISKAHISGGGSKRLIWEWNVGLVWSWWWLLSILIIGARWCTPKSDHTSWVVAVPWRIWVNRWFTVQYTLFHWSRTDAIPL